MGVLHRSDIGERNKSADFFKWFVQRLLHQWDHMWPEVNEHSLGLPVPKTAQTESGAQKIHHERVQQHTTASALGDTPYRVEDSQANGEMTVTLARVDTSQKGLEEWLLDHTPQGLQSSPARTYRSLPQLLRQERDIQMAIDLVQTLNVSLCCGLMRVHIGNQITGSNFSFEIIAQEPRQVDSRGLATEKGFQAVRQSDGAGGKERVSQL